MKSKIRSGLAKMKESKAAGPDGILIDWLATLGNFSIDKIIKITNETVVIYQKNLVGPFS